MATQRIYRCPEHPDKTYTSWRKFRGHWSTLHRGEECPPREEFLEMMEKEERIEEKKEIKETKREEREAAAETPGGFELSDDPVPRLSRILEVHGAPPEAIAQILGVFQIHPGYQNNPVNLHYLLTAKLNRKLHSSIPMIISAFQNQEANYPEGNPMMMMGGMGGPQGMPPYMMGGGYPQFYPSSYGMQPVYRPSMGGTDPPGEEGPRRRERETSPVQDAVALLGTLMDLKDKLGGESGGGSAQVQEIFEGFRTTIEEMNRESKDQVGKLLETFEKTEEAHKAALEGIKGQFHEQEKGRLQDKIEALERTKDEERSGGLGELIKEAGAGAAAQLEGVRSSVTEAGNKIGSLAEQIVSIDGLPKGPQARGASSGRSISDVAGLMEAEEEVEALANLVEGS